MRRIGRFLHIISFSLLERRYLGGWVVGGMVIVMLDKSSLSARLRERACARTPTHWTTHYHPDFDILLCSRPASSPSTKPNQPC